MVNGEDRFPTLDEWAAGKRDPASRSVAGGAEAAISAALLMKFSCRLNIQLFEG